MVIEFEYHGRNMTAEKNDFLIARPIIHQSGRIQLQHNFTGCV